MKRQSKYETSRIERIAYDSGESIEEMVRRCLANNEPIQDTAPLIYTEKKDGVLPQYDPRTDRQEIALEALDVYNKSLAAETDKTIDAPSPQASEENNE